MPQFQEEYEILLSPADAYVRYLPEKSRLQGNRKDFLRSATATMRRIVVDHVGPRPRINYAFHSVEMETPCERDVRPVHDAIRRLEELSKRRARIVELRLFVGLSTQEIAGVLSISHRMVMREWRVALAWLQDELFPASHRGSGDCPDQRV